jgi:sec-independent protein translocase protein TatB
MFDIGFSELILVGVVALLVIGPERLPETVRTATLWLNRIRRGFNEIKQEVQQELHNDAVMRDLRETREQLKKETAAIGRDLHDTTGTLTTPASPETPGSLEQENTPAEKQPE